MMPPAVRRVLFLLTACVGRAAGLTHSQLRGADSTSWAVCSFDWDAPGTYKSRDPRFLYTNAAFDGLTSRSWDEFQAKCFPDVRQGVDQLTQKEKVKVLMGMTQAVGDSLSHDIDVPWYLGYGALVGQLRFASFLPWDDDVDIIVPRESRLKILEHYTNNTERYPCFVEHGKTRMTWDAQRSLGVFTVLADRGHSLKKTFWWDPVSNVVIDGCFDCQYEWDRLFTSDRVDDVIAGSIPIQMPPAAKIWAEWPGLLGIPGVDHAGQAIWMPTSSTVGASIGWGQKSFWCERYTCDGSPDLVPAAAGSRSYRDYLAKDPERMFKSIMFQIDGDSAHCSIPVSLNECRKESTIKDAYKVSTCV